MRSTARRTVVLLLVVAAIAPSPALAGTGVPVAEMSYSGRAEVAAGDVVVFDSSPGELAGMTTTGERIWSLSCERAGEPGCAWDLTPDGAHVVAATPVDDTVEIVSVDPATGEILATLTSMPATDTFPRMLPGIGHFFVTDDRAIHAGGDGYFETLTSVALDGTGSTLLWTFDPPTINPRVAITPDGATVLVGGSALHAIDIVTGAGVELLAEPARALAITNDSSTAVAVADSGIWAVTVDATEATQLSATTSVTRVALAEGAGSFVYEDDEKVLRHVPLDGSTPAQVVTDAFDGWVVTGTGGHVVWVGSTDGGEEVVAMDLSNGDEIRISADLLGIEDSAFSWPMASASGSIVSFADADQLFVVDLDAGVGRALYRGERDGTRNLTITPLEVTERWVRFGARHWDATVVDQFVAPIEGEGSYALTRPFGRSGPVRRASNGDWIWPGVDYEMTLYWTMYRASQFDILPLDLPMGGAFEDDERSIHRGWIEAIAHEGITKGCDTARYCPDALITRAQMASLLARALELPPGPTNRFTDVDPESVHAASIGAIAQAGISLGCDAAGSIYCPHEHVTRAQMASFLARALDLAPADPAFDDVDTANIHARSIGALAEAHITTGCGDGDYCPNAPVSRGQMATFVGRALDVNPLVPPAPLP